MSRSEHFRMGALSHAHMLKAAQSKALSQLHIDVGGNYAEGAPHAKEVGRIYSEAPRIHLEKFSGSMPGSQMEARNN